MMSKIRPLPPLVLGIDAASFHTGLALLDGPTPVALGVVSATAPLLADRLADLMLASGDFWLLHCSEAMDVHRGLAVAIEWPPYMSGRPGQAEVYAAAGAMTGWAWRLLLDAQVSFMPLARWKSAIVRGSGARASKEEVRAALLLRYPSLRAHPAMATGSKSDPIDALGVATAWLDEWEFASRGQEPPPLSGRTAPVRKSVPRRPSPLKDSLLTDGIGKESGPNL